MSDSRPDPRHGWAELLLVRCAFAGVIAWCFLPQEFFGLQPHPHGLARVFDLTLLGEPGVGLAARLVLLGALALYASGIFLPAVTLTLFVLTVWIGTLANSQGAISHDTQIVPLVLLGQLVAHLRFAVARLQPNWIPVWVRPRPGVGVQDLAFCYAQQMVASVYVTAGIVKLLRSRGRWVLDLPDISVEIVKTHAQAFYNHLDPSLVAGGESIANLILAHPHLARFIFSGGLVLELCAFLALRGRVSAFVVGSLLIVMHQGVEQVMMLSFRANQFVLLIFLVNVPFLAIQIASRRWRP